MNVRAALRAIVAVVVTGLMAHPAMAERVSIRGHGQDEVKKECSGDGDVSWTKHGSNRTYGCMHADGSGIVCGGNTAEEKKTCDTFRTASFPVPKLPTRDAASKADAVQK